MEEERVGEGRGEEGSRVGEGERRRVGEGRRERGGEKGEEGKGKRKRGGGWERGGGCRGWEVVEGGGEERRVLHNGNTH